MASAFSGFRSPYGITDANIPISNPDRERHKSSMELGLPSPDGSDALRTPGCAEAGEDVMMATGSAAQTPSTSSLPHNPLPDAVLLAPTTPEETRDYRIPQHGTNFPMDVAEMMNKPAQTMDLSLPTLPVPKAARNLRLPSFDMLGIAAPHPDRIRSDAASLFSELGAGPLSKPEDPLHELSPVHARARLGEGRCGREKETAGPGQDLTNVNHKTIHNLISTFTPPDEILAIDWTSNENAKTAAPEMEQTKSSSEKQDQHDGDSSQSVTPTVPKPSVVISTDAETGDLPTWLKGVVDTMTEHLESIGFDEAIFKVLSHALPCPSPGGHVFATIINQIQLRFLPQSTVWINVFHAVPGKFNMSDLPTSPPATPGPAVGGEDYFTTKVFDSAVSVLDYQNEPMKLHSSPNPIVPPGTVHLSIVERYIPPSNVNEFAELFMITGRSILVDRLIELCPKTGMLIFIYPTRAGGETFAKDYLGPLLDPILRSMTIVNGLSADLAASLGPIDCVKHLLDFDTMKRRLEGLCRRLSRGNSTSSLSRYNDDKASYALAYAAEESIVLDRKVWSSEWWGRQEKARVRAAVTRYFRLSHRLPEDSEMVPTTLIQEVLDGVATREHPAGAYPGAGVGVGVFVVKRTS